MLLLKKLIVSGGLLASLAGAAPALADECAHPRPPVTYQYENVRYNPEYRGPNGVDADYYRDPYAYRNPYADWRRRDAWERHRRWEGYRRYRHW
jgi:hypothetical protein